MHREQEDGRYEEVGIRVGGGRDGCEGLRGNERFRGRDTYSRGDEFESRTWCSGTEGIGEGLGRDTCSIERGGIDERRER